MTKIKRKWADRFMGLAHHIAQWSADPSTKVGAVVVGPDHELRSTGYNDLPRGVKSTPRRWERPLKLSTVVHAECNAIDNAARVGVPLKGCTMYIDGLLPCAVCAGHIIQAGITVIVVRDKTMPERWAESMREGVKMMMESGVEIVCMKPKSRRKAPKKRKVAKKK